MENILAYKYERLFHEKRTFIAAIIWFNQVVPPPGVIIDIETLFSISLKLLVLLYGKHQSL